MQEDSGAALRLNWSASSVNSTDVATACVAVAARDVHGEVAQCGREQFAGQLLNSCWALTSLGRQLLVPFPQAVSPLPPMRAAVLLPQDLPGADAALYAE